jgi:cytidylate kinase
MNAPQMPLNDQLYISQSEINKKLADEGPCIILGRCSDYVLKDRDDVLNVFLHADLDTRVERISNKLGFPKSKAKELIKKTDKRRASYYNYYTRRKWGDLKNFDLAINSSLGIDKVVSLIETYYNVK